MEVNPARSMDVKLARTEKVQTQLVTFASQYHESAGCTCDWCVAVTQAREVARACGYVKKPLPLPPGFLQLEQSLAQGALAQAQAQQFGQNAGQYQPPKWGLAYAPPAAPKSALLEAEATLRQREDGMGPGVSETTHARIGAMWGAILDKHVQGEPIPARTVALMLAAFKIARDVTAPKRDNLVDGAAYFGLAGTFAA